MIQYQIALLELCSPRGVLRVAPVYLQKLKNSDDVARRRSMLQKCVHNMRLQKRVVPMLGTLLPPQIEAPVKYRSKILDGVMIRPMHKESRHNSCMQLKCACNISRRKGNASTIHQHHFLSILRKILEKVLLQVIGIPILCETTTTKTGLRRRRRTEISPRQLLTLMMLMCSSRKLSNLRQHKSWQLHLLPPEKLLSQDARVGRPLNL